jgi:hypothetical protein
MSAALMIAATLGCSGAGDAEQEDGAGSQDELVSEQTFARATDVLRRIDYLPFEYKENGCFARALYMTMELAATGQESNVVFAFANGGNPLKVGDIQWVYHVAPMLWVGASSADARWMVIDPSLRPHPLTVAEWITAMGYPPSTPSDRAPTFAMVPGSNYHVWANATHYPANSATDVPSFDALPNFKVSNASRACRTMFRFLTKENAADVARKKSTLLSRTPRLLQEIDARQKLTRDAEFSATDCASALPDDVEPPDPQ